MTEQAFHSGNDPRGAWAVQKEEGDKRAEDWKPETGELCKQMILSPLAVLPLSPPSDQLPTLHTEGTQSVNSNKVSATIWDTLARKDVGWCSEHGHNPQFYDMS